MRLSPRPCSESPSGAPAWAAAGLETPYPTATPPETRSSHYPPKSALVADTCQKVTVHRILN